MNPVASVIILTFNSQDFIARALASVRRQTYRDIEIVVVDAGSTDRTKQIVSDFGGVVWLDLPKSDMGMARNHGVRHSRGQFLMFLDSDDFYLDHKVESQVAAMNARPEIDVLYGTAYHYRSGETGALGVKTASRKRLTLTDFLGGNMYSLATICIRRSAWEHGLAFGEGELGRYGEDWRFQLSVARKGVPFDLLDVPAVVVEIREGSHTSWEIQPKMKALALATVQDAMTAAQAQGITIAEGPAILDAYRFKLTLSLILVGRIAEAAQTLRDMQPGAKAGAARLLLALAAVLPASWIRGLIQRAWTRRQNDSFSWSRPSQAIDRQISALTLNQLSST
jgi:hypothetical protein